MKQPKTSQRRPIRRTISQRSELIADFHAHGINPDTREIVLMSDPNNPEEGIDYCCANTFIKNLLLLNSLNHLPILVHQITCGGEWNYGMAIYDAIVASRAPTILVAYAHSRSMSSVIPQAAKRRVIMPNTDFLIHFGTQAYEGDARSFEAEGKWSERLNRRMVEIYAVKCSRGPFFRRKKMSREKVRQYLWNTMNEKREWYMTPDEAVDLGFMDGVFGRPPFRTWDEIRKV
jgi:ATP-dependent protease ClpP protease subunit